MLRTSQSCHVVHRRNKLRENEFIVRGNRDSGRVLSRLKIRDVRTLKERRAQTIDRIVLSQKCREEHPDSVSKMILVML